MTEPHIDQTLDLKGVLCPLNFVKAKMKLEEMASGEILELFLDDDEATSTVPRNLKNEGHRIISIEKRDDAFRMLVARGA